jgi:choline dehydrogenase-like flavoprotein
MTSMDYDLTILGGGSGGLTAARIAASLGARVLLIDNERLGGECLYTGCVPSKSLIHVARLIDHVRTAARLGLNASNIEIDMAQVADSFQSEHLCPWRRHRWLPFHTRCCLSGSSSSAERPFAHRKEEGQLSGAPLVYFYGPGGGTRWINLCRSTATAATGARHQLSVGKYRPGADRACNDRIYQARTGRQERENCGGAHGGNTRGRTAWRDRTGDATPPDCI